MQYWLFKTEPGCFSLDDLKASPKQTTSWDGVRNYQARNFMQAMELGDRGFFYHSGKKPGIVGVVEVVRKAYADHTAQDPKNQHYDPAATPANPRWYMVDVRLLQECVPVTLPMLREEPELAHMELLRKGSRLSVQPVTSEQFLHIMQVFVRDR